MKKLVFIFLMFLIACKTTTNVRNNGYYSYLQLDSTLVAERVLTYDSLPLQDFETKKWFYEYYFIRDSLVLRWIKRGDSVQIYKRIDK